MRNGRGILQSERGSVLLMAMILMVVIAVFVEVRMMSSDSSARSERTRRIYFVRDYLVHQLAEYSTLPAALTHSMSTSSNLKSCVMGTSCPGAGKLQPLTFMSPLVSQTQRVAGPPSNPLLYDQFANICNGKFNLSSCPVSVTTEFIANCPGSGCGPNNTIQVVYTVSVLVSSGSSVASIQAKSPLIPVSQILADSAIPVP